MSTTEPVTLDSISEGKDYAPRVGVRYELAEGVIAKMRLPTIGLQQRVAEVFEGARDNLDPETGEVKKDASGVELKPSVPYPDAAMALLVTDHPDTLKIEDVIVPVASQVCRDFFSFNQQMIVREFGSKP